MKTASEIIGGLGGEVRVAQSLGITPPAVRRWIRENRIPLSRQQEVLHLAIISGYSLTVADLMALGAKAKVPESQPIVSGPVRFPDPDDIPF